MDKRLYNVCIVLLSVGTLLSVFQTVEPFSQNVKAFILMFSATSLFLVFLISVYAHLGFSRVPFRRLGSNPDSGSSVDDLLTRVHEQLLNNTPESSHSEISTLISSTKEQLKRFTYGEKANLLDTPTVGTEDVSTITI